MKIGSYFLPVAVLLTLLPINQSFAQTTVTLPDCASADSDVDGDGFGWENSQSCLVVGGQAQQAHTGQCIDTDGDGFGWNGIETCDPSNTAVVVDQSQTLQCTDLDGDGFGWNGFETCDPSITAVITEQTQQLECVDLDGDGWGWDGSSTCRITTSQPTSSAEPAITPYINRYESYTFATWPLVTSAEAQQTIQNWTVRPEDAAAWAEHISTFDYSNGWTPPLLNQRSHVVLCEDPGTVMQHPSIPGFFYDASRAETCSQSDIVEIPSPVSAIEFNYIGSEVLYENGNQWNCTWEERPSMDVAFEATGRQFVDTYESGNSVEFIQVPGYHRNHFEYKDNTLFWYSSGLRRKRCERIVDENFPFTVYGQQRAETYRKMLDAFVGDSTPLAMRSESFPVESKLEAAPAHLLAGQSLQCARLSSTSTESKYGGNETFRFNAIEKIVNVTFLEEDEYHLSGFELPDSIWTESGDGVFRLNDVILPGYTGIAIYQYGEEKYILHTLHFNPPYVTTEDIYACDA